MNRPVRKYREKLVPSAIPGLKGNFTGYSAGNILTFKIGSGENQDWIATLSEMRQNHRI